MEILKISGIYIISYLIGSIPFSQILASFVSPGINLKNEGTGHVGGSNVFITIGPFTGILSIILDMLKPIIAIITAYYLMSWNFNEDLWFLLLITLFVKAGHDFPILLKFNGGKGLSTISGTMFFFGHWYWLILHTLYLFTLLYKKRTKSIKLGSFIMISIIPIEGFLWLTEMYLPLGFFSLKLSNYFPPIITNTWPLFCYSIIWTLLFFLRRLYGCGLINDLKQGISPWRAILLRGLFATYPRESIYRNPGKNIKMGEDD